MRFSPPTLLLPLLTLLTATSAISLTDFQPINGFSSACTKAYSTPLKDCSVDDFGGGYCSTQCIAFLEALTDILNQQCEGTSALPSTLMGLFYIGRGTSALCPNVVGILTGTVGLVSGQGTVQTSGYNKNTVYATSVVQGYASSSTQQEKVQSTLTSYSSSASSSQTSSTTTTSSSSASSSTTSSRSSSSSASSSSASSHTSITTTITSVSTRTITPTTTQPPSSSRSPTQTSSVATQTTTVSNNGGGGTILDIGSSAPPNARSHIFMTFLVSIFIASMCAWR